MRLAVVLAWSAAQRAARRSVGCSRTPGALLSSILLCSILGLAACSTLPAQIAPEAGKVLIRSERSDYGKVLIRSVDGGEILWLRGYKLGTSAWLYPGLHRIGVMCEIRRNCFAIGGCTDLIIAPAHDILEIELQTGHTYYLNPTLRGGEASCDVSVRDVTNESPYLGSQ